MLKLKRIDLLTKNDTIHKNGCCDHVQKYKKLECLCWEEGRVGMRGWLQFGRGEVGWGRRNRAKECRQSGYIFTFADRIINGHIPSIYPSVIVSRHCTEIPVWIPRHSVGKIVWKNPRYHAIATFYKNYIIYQ